MADWTANTGFGGLSATRDLVFRTNREATPRPAAQGLRAERAAPLAEAEAPRLSPGVAALAEFNAGHGGPLAKARLALWAGGGVVSLALMAGIGVWGYKLVLREVMGLPVVAASDGPMRVAPSDPQGEVVPQQGLAVNAIPAAGTVAPPSDVLVLAPQTPGLAEEDMEVVQTMAEADEPMPVAETAEAVAAPEMVTVPEATAMALVPETTTTTLAPEATAALAPAVAAAPLDAAATTPLAAVLAEVAPEAAPTPQVARLVAALLPADRTMTTEEILAFADQISAQAQTAAADPAGSSPLSAALAEVPADTAPVAVPAVAVIPADVPGVAVALKPPARPAVLGGGAAAQAVPVSASVAPVAAEPAAAPAAGLPTGTHLVQLGAFDSPAIAASEWARLQGVFGEFLGGREHVVQETQSGGRTLYRLRALGFADRADARRLCAALTAEDAACIPVTVD